MPSLSTTESGGLSDFYRELINHLRAHSLRTDGPFTLRSGEQSQWYLDARQTCFAGDGAALVGRVVLEALSDDVTTVGGMTMGADPMAVSTALVAAQQGRALRAFSVRKDSKQHGVGGRLVGPVSAGDVVAALDDTVTTGGALGEAIDVMQEAGLQVRQAIALVDRSGGAARRTCESRGVPFRALALPSDLGVDEE